MKKYTDTELLEKLLPMLSYSINYGGDEDNDIIDFKILESSGYVSESFVVALRNRINELAEETRVEATNIIVDKDTECTEKCNTEDKNIGYCPSEDCCGDACEDADAGCVSINEKRGVEHTSRRWGDCEDDEYRWDKCIPIYSAREYDKLKIELIEREHELWKLKGKVETLEYLIYNCIPKDDRRKY